MNEFELAKRVSKMMENQYFQVQPGEPKNPRDDPKNTNWFLAKRGDKVFEVSCSEVDPGAWLDDLAT